MIKKILQESTGETRILEYLKNSIKNTEWDNRVYIAGGYVRDEIMGIKPKDLDFLILGDLDSGIVFAEWLGKQLGNFKEGSNPVVYPRFGTAKLSLRNNNSGLPITDLEFVAPRKEQYTPGSRKPDVISGELEDDALRRDLTINSLLKNITTGDIVDITGNGISDIKNGVIRTTSDPDVIFKEDPLRMLRAIRFAVKYDFDIERYVLKGIRKNSELITTISKERISDELNKILLTKNPSKGIKLLKVTNLLIHVLDEFNGAVGMKQNKHHKDDVFGHTLSVLDKTPPELKTRLMALFHDIGKVLTKSVSPGGSVHFYEHEMVGEEMVKKIMSRLKYPKELINSVALGVRHHMSLKHGNDDTTKLTDKSLRKFMAAVGENLEEILDLIHADNISHSDDSSMPNQIKIVKERIKNLETDITEKNIKLPINGDDLIRMGLKPSKLFRDILNAVQERWYENPNMTIEDAITIVDKIKLDNNINEIKILLKKLI